MLPLKPHLSSLSQTHQQALRVAAGCRAGPAAGPLPGRDGRARPGRGGRRGDTRWSAPSTTPTTSMQSRWRPSPSSPVGSRPSRRRCCSPAATSRDSPTGPRECRCSTSQGWRRMPRRASCRRALPEPIDPAAAAQIATATGGNPLALLDLASELDARRLTESSLADEPIPVGHTLEAFYLRRVRHLDPDLQQWLLVAAADSTGNVDLIRSAAKSLGVGDVAGRGRRARGAGDAGRNGRVPASARAGRRSTTPRPAPNAAASTARCRWPPRTCPSSSWRPGTPPRRRSAPTPRSPTGSSGSPTSPARAAASSPGPACWARPRR